MTPTLAKRLTSALATTALTLALLENGCARGCEDDSTGPAAPGSGSTHGGHLVPLPRYFPLHRGDRWRTRAGRDGTMPRVFGVTGIDARGVAVVFGGPSTTPERYTASATQIARTDERGRALVPLLRAPLLEGATWSYTLAERGVSIPCDARILRLDAAARTIRGVSLRGCATVRRSCHYPVGTPFPLATTHTQDETYCPDIGLVRAEQRFSPPPSPGLLPTQTTERLVTWNVAGGPVPPARASLDCDDVLLLPSDVRAACGASLAPVGEPAGALENGECVLRFAGGGHFVEVRVRSASSRSPQPPPATVPPLPGTGPRPGDRGDVAADASRRIVVRTPRAEVTVDGCDDPRLTPLMRSLFP